METDGAVFLLEVFRAKGPRETSVSGGWIGVDSTTGTLRVYPVQDNSEKFRWNMSTTRPEADGIFSLWRNVRNASSQYPIIAVTANLTTRETPNVTDAARWKMVMW